MTEWADCFDQYECHLRGCYGDDVGVHGCAGKAALLSYLNPVVPMCDHCGGSGVLNVEESSMGAGHWDARPYASPCHCPAGATWKEVGLDG